MTLAITPAQVHPWRADDGDMLRRPLTDERSAGLDCDDMDQRRGAAPVVVRAPWRSAWRTRLSLSGSSSTCARYWLVAAHRRAPNTSTCGIRPPPGITWRVRTIRLEPWRGPALGKPGHVQVDWIGQET